MGRIYQILSTCLQGLFSYHSMDHLNSIKTTLKTYKLTVNELNHIQGINIASSFHTWQGKRKSRNEAKFRKLRL